MLCDVSVLQCVWTQNDAASDWQLMELDADDITELHDDDVGNSPLPDAEAVTLPGVRHLGYVLTGLAANTTYAGRLRATNIFGSSDWSPTFKFKTTVQRMFAQGGTI